MRDDHENPQVPAAPGTGDEQVLRSLLAGAVQGLEPSEGALERLRHAVPARRARKRQALVGAAAAALLAGTAIPAALHLGTDQGAGVGNSAMAGHGEAEGGKTPGPSDPHQNGSGDGTGTGPKAAKPVGADQDAGGADGKPSPQASGSPSGGTATGGPTEAGASAGTASGAGHGPPPVGAAPGVPGCTAGQLGVAGSARAPGPDGKVLGSFKVTNVSAKGCTVTGPDTVTAAAVPAGQQPAQSAGVTVTGHTAGDPASGLLPDPSAETPVLFLEPNTAYEVRFAWVPSGASCPAPPGPSAKPQQGDAAPTAGTEGASGAPAAAPGGDAAAAAAAAPGPDPQTGGTGTQPAGVAVSHTPASGDPVTRTTIPEACGGTVYRTGILPQTTP
ncbi:hypothetical protein Slala03_67650 [Streptomyces lavendulae subsp. lavendulae]|uniref:hypothetical protein n=1 Tax=Streptomyces lavendulae TaxID=1914 RepID=UPI0024A32250|nr:hypothetical protein [Streptomyces lavendulae]GLV87076.1 hypothetical protein Slala03_67650 [Streptomyces lavendulae subsp. lavendulae]GLX35032.1 hypothetical protein Sros01_11050 [Streptomyces roseochromogenus]